MQTQDERDDEIIDEILRHWDDDNWPPRMPVEEYIMRKSGISQ